MEDKPEHQDELDRQIRIASLPARGGPAWRLPPGNRPLVQPEREIASPLQPSLVGRPVLDAILSPRNVVTAAAVMFERQGVGSPVGGPASLLPRLPIR